MISICAFCKTKYVAPNLSRKYCSRSCYWKSMTRTLAKECLSCGKTFHTYKEARKYCSRPCFDIREQDSITIKCGQCGRLHKTSHSRTKFCSSECYGDSKRGLATWNKGKKTGIAPWLNKKRALSTIEKMKETKRLRPYRHTDDAKRKIGAAFRGKSRGGNTNAIASIRGMFEYKRWRQAVFKRDDFACCQCGQRGGKLNADHIIPFAVLLLTYRVSTIEDAHLCSNLWDVENGRTLCLPCHKLTPTFASGTRDVALRLAKDRLKTGV